MRRGIRPSVPAALLIGAVLLAGACRFERRPEPEEGNDPIPADTALQVAGATRDSVRAVVRAFHEALRVGDGSRLASLSVLGATVVDQEEGVEWRLGPAGGERLPSPLLAGPAGLGWERIATDFVAWPHAALVVDRYRATVAGEVVPWTAVETFVLERAEDGQWLIRHVHRSRGVPPASGERLGPADGG